MGKKRIEVNNRDKMYSIDEIMQVWAMDAKVDDEDIVLTMTAKIPLSAATAEMREALGL